jgi:dolichol-phosphate mannosyltransferase
MKRIAITGGSGFVGANLARRLLRDGHEVHLLLRPGHAHWRLAEIQADVRLHIVDFENAAEVTRAVAAIRPEWIFHLAAYGAYPTQADLFQMVRTNIIGLMNLVNAGLAADCEAFVNAGSSSEYGFKDHAPPETELLEPNSHYAVTKASATMFCTYTARTRGVRIPTLRLYSVYGPYEEPARLIPTLIRRGLDGKLPPLVNPKIARDYVHSDDVSDAFILAAGQQSPDPGAVYNVGTGVQTTLEEVVGIVRRLMDIPEEPRWGSMPSRIWDTSSWVCENSKIARDLGWKPSLSLEDGLLHTIAWMRAHRDLYPA